MKCWKCGKDNADGASTCAYCGTKLSRPAPVTPAGTAMRKMYDRYGSEQVLTSNSFLVAALGDVLEDSKKLRNQLSSAMEAGIGDIYRSQLQNVGQPDSAFTQKVKTLLTEDAGLSDKAASDLMGYFDEMIGWTAPRQTQQSTPRPTPQPSYQQQSSNPTYNANGERYRDQPPVEKYRPQPEQVRQPEAPKPEPQPEKKAADTEVKVTGFGIAWRVLGWIMILGCMIIGGDTLIKGFGGNMDTQLLKETAFILIAGIAWACCNTGLQGTIVAILYYVVGKYLF